MSGPLRAVQPGRSRSRRGEQPRYWATAKVLGLLRRAVWMTIDETAAKAAMAPLRLRQLERGSDEPRVVESFALAKALELCPTDFRKHLEIAARRDPLPKTSAAQPGAVATESATNDDEEEIDDEHDEH